MAPDLIDYTDAPVRPVRKHPRDWLVDRLEADAAELQAFGRAVSKPVKHPPGVQPDSSGKALSVAYFEAVGRSDYRRIFLDRVAIRNKRITTWARAVYRDTNWNAAEPYLRCIGNYGESWDRGTRHLHAPKCKAVLRYRWPA